MCQFWEDPTVEILVGSDELNALELEFGIEFDDDAAMKLYDARVQEAAILIKKMIQEQSDKGHDSEQIVDALTPELATRVLREIWRDSFKARSYIIAAIEKIDHADRTRNIKQGKQAR